MANRRRRRGQQQQRAFGANPYAIPEHLLPTTPVLKARHHKDAANYAKNRIQELRTWIMNNPNHAQIPQVKEEIKEYQRQYLKEYGLYNETDPRQIAQRSVDPQAVHIATKRSRTTIKNPRKGATPPLTAGAAIQRTLALMNPIDVAFWRMENLRAIGYDENDFDDLNNITQYREYLRQQVDDFDILGKKANLMTANTLNLQTPVTHDLNTGDAYFNNINESIENKGGLPIEFQDGLNLVEKLDVFEEYDPLNYPYRNFHFFHVIIWQIN